MKVLKHLQETGEAPTRYRAFLQQLPAAILSCRKSFSGQVHTLQPHAAEVPLLDAPELLLAVPNVSIYKHQLTGKMRLTLGWRAMRDSAARGHAAIAPYMAAWAVWGLREMPPACMPGNTNLINRFNERALCAQKDLLGTCTIRFVRFYCIRCYAGQ